VYLRTSLCRTRSLSVLWIAPPARTHVRADMRTRQARLRRQTDLEQVDACSVRVRMWERTESEQRDRL
jgi:hypothetical protein